MSKLTNPHDVAFRESFGNPRQAGSLLRAVLPIELSAQIDWSTLAMLDTSVFFGPDVAERRADLLFGAQLGHTELLLYAVLEHQSKSDRWMAVRLLERVVGISRRLLNDRPDPKYLPVILPIVVHHGRSRWTAATHLRDLIAPEHRENEMLRQVVPDFEFILWDLTQEEDDGIARKVDSLMARLALAMLKHASYEMHVRWLQRWVPDINSLLDRPEGAQQVNRLMSYVMHVGDSHVEEIHNVLRSGLDSDRVDQAMSTAEQLRQEGRQEGQQEGRAELVLRQLRLRFTDVPDVIVDRVRAGTNEQLDLWAERVLTASSLQDVFA